MSSGYGLDQLLRGAEGEECMTDLLMIITMLAVFAVMFAFVVWFDRI